VSDEPGVPLQRPQPVLVQARVQFAVLLQIAEHETATRRMTATICRGTDWRDFEAALENLLDEGSLCGPNWRLDTLFELAEGGWLSLTDRGRQRLFEADA
jgi:hypothetical protein